MKPRRGAKYKRKKLVKRRSARRTCRENGAARKLYKTKLLSAKRQSNEPKTRSAKRKKGLLEKSINTKRRCVKQPSYSPEPMSESFARSLLKATTWKAVLWAHFKCLMTVLEMERKVEVLA